MIITALNESIAEVHDRMPVILVLAPWLIGAAGEEVLRPPANDILCRWPVSTRVNSSRTSNEDAALIEGR
jgi:putative SOS response-associated peptidase YedK